jgi:uncharacterized protein YyaL (SSP411 family)
MDMCNLLEEKMTKRKKRPSSVYSLMDELMASATEPMPKVKQNYQLTRMYGGLRAIEKALEPTIDDWRVVSDAVNLMETLIYEMKICEDANGLLKDATKALEAAGNNSVNGKGIRMDTDGITAVRSILEDYAALIEVIPHRDMVHCHRLTEKRILGILAGKNLPHDVKVVAL